MDDFYTKTAESARALIQKRGRKIDVVHLLDATVNDPNKPWDASPTPEPPTFPTYGVFTAYDSKDVDGEKIRSTDLKLLVSPVGMPFEIANRDIIKDSKLGALSIQDIDTIEPGELRVLYTLQVRR